MFMKFAATVLLVASLPTFAQVIKVELPAKEEVINIHLQGDKGNIDPGRHFEGYYGADALVCRNNKNQVLQASLLDYAEIYQKGVQTPIAWEPNLNHVQFINALSKKLEKISPDVFMAFKREALKLAEQFQTVGTNYYKARADVSFFKDLKLVEVPDAALKPIQTKFKGCKIEQLVIREKKFLGVYYYIQWELFSLLTPKEKRGLIIHEALYHAFNMYYGDEDSERTRYYHRSIMKWTLGEMTEEKLMTALSMAFIKF